MVELFVVFLQTTLHIFPMNDEAETSHYWVAREGQVYGPYGQPQFYDLLEKGELLLTDQVCICIAGQEKWVLLSDLAEDQADPAPPKTTAPTKKVRKPRPPSPRQAAYIAYLGWPVPDSAEEAGDLLNELSALPELETKKRLWVTERLRLHPDLYELELKEAQRAEARRHVKRPQEMRDWCNGDLGIGNPIKRISLSVARDAVEYLDQNYPGWDANIYGEFGLEWAEVDAWFPSAVLATHPECVKKDYWSEWEPGGRYRTL